MPIAINGLAFYDSENAIAWRNATGAPDWLFGIEIARDDVPLLFSYEAIDSVSSFDIIKIDRFGNDDETISLSTSLITSNSSTHYCSGIVEYITALDCGVYYFSVNDRYKSDTFKVVGFNQGIDFDVIESGLIVY